MIEWRDQGILLAVRPHGEHAAIAQVFTAHHGRHAGVVRGATSRKTAPILQPGAQLDVTWKARLEDHIGAYQVEPVRSRAAVMADPLALSGMTAALGLLAFALPERDAGTGLYDPSVRLMDMICAGDDGWPVAYLQWEVALLKALGFGLSLHRCAVSGETENLTYVSPKSGRAVAAHHAGKWKSRLLPLVPCMTRDGPAPNLDIAEGLRTTGYFLKHHLAPALGNHPLPEARARFHERLYRDGQGG